MKILIYEDSGYKNLYPLNLLRASYDIRCGANTVLQRIESIINDKFAISLHSRYKLASYLKEVHKHKINSITKDDYLLLNGRVIFNDDSIEHLVSKKEKNSYYVFKDQVVAARIAKDRIQQVKEKVEGTDNVLDKDFFETLGLKSIALKHDFNIQVMNYAWDVIDYILHGGLEEDFGYLMELKKKKRFHRIKKSINFICQKKIFISNKSDIHPNVVLDASEGRIVIEENSKVEPFSFIKGPVFIGKNCLIKSGSRIYGPCVIGENSKVAGEIAESVFHSFVNKQHDGFTGHSYICPFVNLGADTVTSDLKNNYSKITLKMEGKDIDTGMQLLGSIIGDHSKTSINTMLNTGSMIGIFANIFGGGFPAKNIEPFTWNESGKNSVKYDIDKALETAKVVMDRRGLKLSQAYGDLVRSYFK